MKKILSSVFALGLLIGFTAQAHAAASQTFQLAVTVAADEISISVDSASLGVIGVGQTAITALGSHANVANDGWGTIRLQVAAVTNAAHTANWTQRTDDPGAGLNADEYRLGAIFTQWDRAVIAGDFLATDICQTTAISADATTHALDAEDIGFKGENVTPGAQRACHFMFQAPATVNNPGAMEIDVTISAILM